MKAKTNIIQNCTICNIKLSTRKGKPEAGKKYILCPECTELSKSELKRKANLFLMVEGTGILMLQYAGGSLADYKTIRGNRYQVLKGFIKSINIKGVNHAKKNI